MSALTTTSIITRSEEVVSGDIDGETVMMSIQKGDYFGLNPVASRIWQMIESPQSVGDICSQLTTEYNVNPATCEQEVLSFLNKLSRDNLIVLK